MSNIPRYIHLHWFGTKPLPDSYQKNLDRWLLLAAGTPWTVVVWTDESKELEPLRTMLVDNGAKPVQVSNAMRFLCVYLFGGLYVDFDIIPLRLPEFEDEDRLNLFTEISWDTAVSNATGEKKVAPNAAYMAAPPKNQQILDCFWRTVQYTVFNPETFGDRLKGGVGVFRYFPDEWYSNVVLRGVNHFAPVNWAQARVLNMVEQYSYTDWVKLAETFLKYDVVYGVHTFDSSWVFDLNNTLSESEAERSSA